jgi:hypothetical protein
MDNELSNKSQDQDTEKLKEIPKWTRKYAQNRMLTPIVLMVMVILFGMFVAALVGFPLILAVAGFWKGNMILGCVGIVVLVAALVAILKFYIFIFAKFGGKNRGLIDQLIEQRIYGKEGTASMPLPEVTKKMRGLDYLVGAICLIWMLGVNSLCIMGYIAFKYQQPLMALYFVPAFVFEYFFLLWPKVGPLVLLWPILYTIHAILILAGVPIFFTGYMRFWNMFIPLFGYFLLAYLIGHLYSRYALKKLKGITHLEGDTANGY